MALEVRGLRPLVDWADLRPGQWIQHRYAGGAAISLLLGDRPDAAPQAAAVFAVQGEAPTRAICAHLRPNRVIGPHFRIDTPIHIALGHTPETTAFLPPRLPARGAGTLTFYDDDAWLLIEEQHELLWVNLMTGAIRDLRAGPEAEGYEQWSIWLEPDRATSPLTLLCKFEPRAAQG